MSKFFSPSFLVKSASPTVSSAKPTIHIRIDSLLHCDSLEADSDANRDTETGTPNTAITCRFRLISFFEKKKPRIN